MVVAARSDPNRFARALFSGLPRHYDVLEEVLSLGQNRRWRRAAVDQVVSGEQVVAGAQVGGAPGRVLDVATGTAGVALLLAQRCGGQVVGIDLTEAMLAEGARRLAGADGGDRVHLVAGRAEELPFPDGAFDGLSFSYLLRYVADPAATLEELARVVKPGGRLASLEFHVPTNPFWRLWWWVYTRLVLPVGGLVAGGRPWFAVGRFLGPDIAGHYRRYPIDWTVEAWQRAGLVDVGTRLMSLGGGLVMWGTRASG